MSECLASIMSQQGAETRVAIFTSTPGPHHELAAQQFGVELRIASTPGGIGENWNRGLSGADSTYVTLAHQDDIYAPTYLTKLLAVMRSHPQALMGFTDFNECDDHGIRADTLNIRIKRRLVARAFQGRPAIESVRDKRRMLAWGNPVCCPSVMLHRGILPQFRFREDLTSNLDWEAWANLASTSGRFCYIDERLVSKRVHAESETTALIANRRRELEDHAMFRQFWPSLPAYLIATAYRLSYRANRTT